MSDFKVQWKDCKLKLEYVGNAGQHTVEIPTFRIISGVKCEQLLWVVGKAEDVDLISQNNNQPVVEDKAEPKVNKKNLQWVL